jgi:phospholipase C
VAETGHSDPANHQCDLGGLPGRLSRRQFPAVNFIKAPSFQDRHAGYSDPLDEQTFLVNLVNFLQQRPNGNAPREHYV